MIDDTVSHQATCYACVLPLSLLHLPDVYVCVCAGYILPQKPKPKLEVSRKLGWRLGGNTNAQCLGLGRDTPLEAGGG